MRALYVSHTGMTEPLGQSQVLPYVRGLVRAGWEIDIVAHEPMTAQQEEITRVETDLRDAGIGYLWNRRSRSHSTAVKVAEASRAALQLVGRALRKRPRIVHARSYLPAAVAHLVSSVIPGAKFLFDVRGLLGEEYVDAGHWAATDARYRLLKLAERRMFARADGVVVLTERHRRWLRDEARLVPPSTPIEVIPCCVDLARFVARDGDRDRTRAELGAGERFVLIYSGTLGAWYREPEMVQLFAEIRRRVPALFVVLTQSPPGRMQEALDRQEIPADEVRFVSVRPPDVPRFLAAADAAVSFIAPCFSKLGSSPTKVAEYLAMGLPVVMNRGIGDSDQLIAEEPAVVDAGALEPQEIAQAAERLLGLDRKVVRGQARHAAVTRFDLDEVGIARYRALYARIGPC